MRLFSSLWCWFSNDGIKYDEIFVCDYAFVLHCVPSDGTSVYRLSCETSIFWLLFLSLLVN